MIGVGQHPGDAERVEYGPYGKVRHSWPADFNGDGFVDGDNYTILSQAFGRTIADPELRRRLDPNRDGVIDSSDLAIFQTWRARAALPAGCISDPGGPDNI